MGNQALEMMEECERYAGSISDIRSKTEGDRKHALQNYIGETLPRELDAIQQTGTERQGYENKTFATRIEKLYASLSVAVENIATAPMQQGALAAVAAIRDRSSLSKRELAALDRSVGDSYQAHKAVMDAAEARYHDATDLMEIDAHAEIPSFECVAEGIDELKDSCLRMVGVKPGIPMAVHLHDIQCKAGALQKNIDAFLDAFVQG